MSKYFQNYIKIMDMISDYGLASSKMHESPEKFTEAQIKYRKLCDIFASNQKAMDMIVIK